MSMRRPALPPDPRPPTPGPRRKLAFVIRLPALTGLAFTALFLAGAGARDPEDQVREIASALRCPVCQNLSVADSPSELAHQMRGVMRERLKAGATREQIEAYFVEKYGEWVLLAPTKRGFNLLAWVLPFVGVVAGVFAVAVLVRRWSSRGREEEDGDGASEAGPPPSPEEARYRERLRRELEDFARR